MESSITRRATVRLIPEYEPVQKLYLSFIHPFFNTRFHYGKAQCEIIEAASPFVKVELFIQRRECEYWQAELEKHPLSADQYTINFHSPGRGVLMEYVPLWAEDDQGQRVGFVFRNSRVEHSLRLKRFGKRMARWNGFIPRELGFSFASANISVNEDVVLLTDYEFRGEAGTRNLQILKNIFPAQHFYVIPSLAGDVTADMDMFLWPVRPRVWIASEYPSGSVEAESMEPSLRILREHGHTVHRVPGLEPIRHDDINTMPNYANGVILNNAALIPAYGRDEDAVVQGILKDYGFTVLPIDCTQIILTQSGIHCISKTVPASRAR
jgi:hypothetical protein